jgi:hypothetical protein
MHTELLKNSQSFAAVLAYPHWVVSGPSELYHPNGRFWGEAARQIAEKLNSEGEKTAKRGHSTRKANWI